ncbi:MAG: EamA family transporter [Lachnospiraceae bacterium]|nr:EamA family transporter [Lachnospiraceae bacterium]MCR5477812.1 EamA family transporter [Lachnospiraceae bacterium]
MIVVLLLASTLTSSFAGYFLKKSGGSDRKLGIFLSPWFYIGGFLYAASAMAMIYMMKVIPYAVILPLGSLTYVWTMFVSNRLLGEKITKRKIAGMCVIITGVAILAYATQIAGR